MARFSPALRKALTSEKYLYIRAGDEHRFIPIWAVIVGDRLFVRPWNDKPGGWYRTFLENSAGAIRIGDKAIPVRARRVRAKKLIDAVDAGYAAKYTTKASLTFVKGFATPKRKATTTELVPA